MSFSMWLALSLKPMGIPPVIERTRSANFLKSLGESKSLKVGGEIAASPATIPRTCAILPIFLLPGRWPPVPVFAPWPPLK